MPVAVDAVRKERGGQREQQAGAKVPFVHAGTEDVDPRAQAMTFDPQHNPQWHDSRAIGSLRRPHEGCIG